MARKRSVAYHEAGHAVAALMLGLEIDEVTVEPDGHALGHVRYAASEVERYNASGEELLEGTTGLDVGEARDFIRRHALATLAGSLAQRKAMPSSVRRHHAAGDNENLADEIELLASSPDDLATLAEVLEADAAQLVDHNWAAVASIARALLADGSLSGEEVQAIVRQCGPTDAEAPK